MPLNGSVVARERKESERGFALVELLVVLLIMGILVAISLPAFLGQREKAQDAEAKSAALEGANAAAAFYTGEQTYAGMDKATLAKIEPTLNDGAGAGLVVDAAGAGGYKVTVDSKSSVKFSYAVDQGTSRAERTCAPKDKGACPSSGKW